MKFFRLLTQGHRKLRRNLAPQVAPQVTPEVRLQVASQQAPGDTPDMALTAAAAVTPHPAAEPAPQTAFPLHPFSPQEMREAVEWAHFSHACRRPIVARITFGPSLPQDRPPLAAEHAYLIAQWLRARYEGCPSIDVPACDLERAYPTFCIEIGLVQQKWQTVAKYLKYFTGGSVSRRIGGRKLRAYPVPDEHGIL
jgi:hypothetical protein